MKIIKIDNYNRESYHYPDILICENIDKKNGGLIIEELNWINKNEDRFYRLVDDNYILQDYDPNKWGVL